MHPEAQAGGPVLAQGAELAQEQLGIGRWKERGRFLHGDVDRQEMPSEVAKETQSKAME